MSEIFLKIVNVSICAGWLVLAVLALRLLLKKAPKWVNVLLWGIVAVRLVCPFSIESAFSLIPSAQTIPPDILVDLTPAVDIGVGMVNGVVNGMVEPGVQHFYSTAPEVQNNPMLLTVADFANVWLLGVLAMALYTLVSYTALRRKLRTAVRLRENIYQCETVHSPFVLGIFTPGIYLPYGMADPHVIAHEKAHIRRFDHWWKPLGFLLLTVHWFNPLMWVAYLLLCRDIELACDEKVIVELGNEQRADYTQALVACSVNRRMIAACPLAFGEVGVKARVKSIMNYRKPTFWIIVTALVVCFMVAVCFLTDPKPAPEFAMKGGNISDLDPEGIVERIMDYQDIENSNVYMNSDNFSLTVDGNFDWADSQVIRYFYYENHKVRSAQLRIFPDENKYFLTESDEWPDQNRIFLLRHYLDALKYLPQEAIQQMAPADQYLIEHIDGGSPSGYARVITYSSEGVGATEGWYLHLRLLPLHEDGEGYSGTGEKAVHLFYGGKPVETRMWFDFLAKPELMDWNMEREYTIDQFPRVTFRCTTGDISVGEKKLIQGMPIWSAYLSDLNGDGYPEICTEISLGSGIIDNRIIVYDYANDVSYTLERRMMFDYHLLRNESDGQLYAEKRSYFSGALLHSGRLILRDGSLQILGEPSPNPAITNIVVPTKEENFACDTAMEKFFEDDVNEYFFSGVYSQYVTVHYEDGTSENIVSAIANGRASLADLDQFAVRYWAEPKSDRLR